MPNNKLAQSSQAATVGPTASKQVDRLATREFEERKATLLDRYNDILAKNGCSFPANLARQASPGGSPLRSAGHTGLEPAYRQ